VKSNSLHPEDAWTSETDTTNLDGFTPRIPRLEISPPSKALKLGRNIADSRLSVKCDGDISLYHRVQTGSGAHPAPYPRAPGALSLRVKAAGV
jgi:hypothetical protein